MRISCIVLVCLLATACSVEEAPPTYVQPKDVKALFARALECQHWAGEEAYSPGRGKEILQAVHRLRCEQLDDDYVALRQKYAMDDAVTADMEQTDQRSGYEFTYAPKH